MRQILTLIGVILSINSFAQQTHPVHSRSVIFPDVPGYKTLRCDLHIHTVFSDGAVWPGIRVNEALRDSLDVVSMTDHIEYLPHRDDIPPRDRNRSYQLAKESAANSGLLVVLGTELTRVLPPGHSNALFLQDVNPFVLDDPMDQFKEAQKQGAFVFWNHPSWEGQQKNTIATLTDYHKELIANGLLHGIEVVNSGMFSEHALQIALDNDLAILGNSDVHGLIDWEFDIESGGHRPATLVLARDRTVESVKEALFDKRTVVFFEDYLIGREEHLMPLLDEIIEVVEAKNLSSPEVVKVTLRNNSSCNLILVNKTRYGTHKSGDVILLPHLGEQTILLQTGEMPDTIELKFEVLSGIIAPKTHPLLVKEVRLSN